VDGRGRTLIPGLIDTHIHLILGPNSPDSEQAYRQWVIEKIPGKFRDFLSHGFTTVMSVGDYWPQVLQVKQRLDSGEFIGPRLILSGPMITPPEGHGASDNLSCTQVPFCRKSWTREIYTKADVQKIVRELSTAGVNGIKVVHDTNDTVTKGKKIGHFSTEMLQYIIMEAHASNLVVRVHAYPIEAAIEAIEMGADRLIHVPFSYAKRSPKGLRDKLINLAHRKEIPVSTTAGVFSSLLDRWGVKRAAFHGASSPFEGSELVPAPIIADLQYYSDSKLTLAFGTDTWPVINPGDSAAIEFNVLKNAGISPMKMLEMATINAAKFVGMDNDIGSIEIGKIADVVLLAGNPLENFEAIERVDLVIKEGQVVYDFAEDNRTLDAEVVN
jgi:imidazolonepropionase-like amidohydrolase